MQIKRVVCAAMAAVMWLHAFVPIFADTISSKGELIFLEKYEGIETGEKPEYGTGWSLDNLSSAPFGYSIAVTQESENNKSLLLSFLGSGAAVSGDVLICRNVSIPAGEVHNFYTDMMSNDTNGNKRIFIRGSSATQQMELIRLQNGYLYIAAEKMGKQIKGHWYSLKVTINAEEKTARIYVDEELRAVLHLNKYDLSSISIRASVIGDGTAGAKTEMYLDNTAYTTGNYSVDFSDDTAQNTPEATVEPDKLISEEPAKQLGSDNMLLCLDNSRAYCGETEINLGAKPVDKSGTLLLPLRTVAENFGAVVDWTAPNQTARVSCNGRQIEITNAKQVAIEDKEYGRAEIIGNAMFVTSEAMTEIVGVKITEYISGGILITRDDTELSPAEVKSKVWELSYQEPSAERILADFEQNSGGVHPRVLVNAARLEKIKEWIEIDENFAQWYARIKRLADNSLSTPVSRYELRDGVRLLYVSREVYTNVVYNAFVYLMEGGERYKDRIWREMEAVCNFADWHPAHFLDTAEMTLAVAICYDWLYDSWSETQRKTMRDAILRLGLDAAQGAYDGTAEYGSEDGAYHNRIGWAKDYSNWGLVSNGGIAVGALAVIGDTESEYCAKIIQEALESVKYPMSLFAPDGAWGEGISYWEYATRYMSYMLQTLKHTNGTYYGYDEVPGIVGTAYFPVYHTGPQGNFNFGDASESIVNAPVLFWFSELLGDPALAGVRLNSMKVFEKSGGIDDLLFYNPEIKSENTELDKERSYYAVGTAMLANNWGSAYANYIGIHGGTVGATHGDLDAGVFVLDAIGERWTVDYGSDDYNLPGYFFWPQRGNYYRKRAEGHSTLVINPDSGLDQKVGAVARIQKMHGGSSGGWAILDMSGAYADDADSAVRMIAEYNDRTKFMVQDEVVMPEKCDVWWLMQTKADIEISEDGKSAVLTLRGKHLLCQLQSSDKNAVFTYTDAVPFETSPKGTGQATNTGYRLAVHSKNVTSLNMRVTFTPYPDGEEPDKTLLKLVSMEQITETDMLRTDTPVFARADAIYADASLIDGFGTQQFYYEIEVDDAGEAMPEITADGSGVSVQVIEETENSRRVLVSAADESGELRDGRYTIVITRSPTTFDKPENGSPAQIKSVIASDIPQEENIPENTIDGDADTKWAAEGRQWIKYDLGEAKTVTAVGTWWMSQTARTQNYSISVSSDGINWEKLFDGKSSKKQNSIEYFMMNKENVRYILLDVNGNSSNTWTSLLETQIYTLD